ncbi:MAG: RHS repeat-associated core domain-containing protein, partial [Bacteroides xylanisolvens]
EKKGTAITNNTRILVDGGYYEGGVYYYYLSDHLGNNRVVANQSGTVIQKNHYYPFGTAFAEGTATEQGKQPYKYNGKELDQMHGLNLYDYSARYYESAIGRFTTVDPLAEKYYSISPYVYVGNNPIIRTDPTGMDWVTDKDNNIIWNDQATSAKNTPKGYTYIGNDDALLSHIGMQYDFPEKKSESPGFVALDENVGMQAARVRETSNVKIGVSTQNVKDNISKSNESGKTFTGVSVTVRDKTMATVIDGDLSSSSRVEVKYGDKTYSKAMQELPNSPNGDIKEYGTNSTIASIVIPVSDINSNKHISSVQVSGTWWATKPEGRTPVVYHGLMPVPVRFTNSWTIRK